MQFFRRVFGVAGTVKRAFTAYPAARQEARHRLLSHVARAMGLKLAHHGLIWAEDPAFRKAWDSFPEKAPFNEKRFNLFYLAGVARGIPGASAECGVLRGAGSNLILNALADPAKTHHIFDSFEGLSEPDARDRGDKKAAHVWQKNDLSVPENTVSRNLAQFPNIALHKGWIPERFDEVANETFSFVHIDVDLYQPTYDSIAFFYPRMAPGAVLVCDDYGFLSCPGSYKAINDYMCDKPEVVVHLTSGQGFFTKKASGNA